MDILFQIVGGALLAFGLFVISMNYLRQYANFKNRNNEEARHSSAAPFVGPVFVMGGYVLLPFEYSNWIYLVLLLDPDTLLILLSIPYLVKGFRQ